MNIISFLEMLLILLTIILVALITYLYLKPLIDNLLYSVSHEPKYIHSYTPLIGFGLEMFKDPIGFVHLLYVKYGKIFVLYLSSKRWIYFYDEQTYLTKVLKSSDLSIDEFLADFTVYGLDVSRQCLTNDEIQQMHLKYFHQYLVGDELEVLNKRVHDSLIESMKHDGKLIQNDQTKIVNFFDLFGEFMLYAGCDGLFGRAFTTEQRKATPNFYRLFQEFDQAFKLGVFQMPFRRILYRSTYENRLKFINRFSSLKLNNGECKLVHAREELFRSDKYKHLFSEYDVGALHAALLWAAVANTGPLSCWSVVDLLLHSEALEAVKQELKENIPSSSTLIYDKEILAKLKILDSCINETIRRVLNTVSTRQAMTNTTVECVDKTKIGLRKGDMLIYPAFLKHFDPNLFGPNPYEYQYDRFVKKPNQPKAPSVMIFGCGTHMCPGRYWAINEIKLLVALIIQHMDIEFVNMTEQDKEDYRKKLPYDYSKFVSSGGPKKGYEYKFDIQYSYKNLV
jgi:oxysterol 7-alpha-hydroxylase